MPAVVDLVSFGSLQAQPEVIDRLSFWTSLVLLGVYGAGLVFTSARTATRSAACPLTRHARDMSTAAGGDAADARHGC